MIFLALFKKNSLAFLGFNIVRAISLLAMILLLSAEIMSIAT